MNDEISEGARWAFAALAVIIILVVGVYWVDRWASPKFAETRRETYQQGAAHVDGTIDELRRLRIDYRSSTSDDHRQAIASLALSSASDLDRRFIEGRDPELYAWLVDLGF